MYKYNNVLSHPSVLLCDLDQGNYKVVDFVEMKCAVVFIMHIGC